MQSTTHNKSTHRRFLVVFAALLLVAGTLMWCIAHDTPRLYFLQATSLPLRLALSAAVLIAALVATVLFLQRCFTRPVHDLVEYVRQQREGNATSPPRSLLQRDDDIGLLTNEIQSLLDTLREQNERLLEQTLNDPLTGLGNRRLLEQRLDVALPLSRRRMAPLSALMVDVDHFKDYNDHYGHPAGDECLVEIANVLRDTFRRETDIVVRLGGEEFLVVLLDVGLDEAMRLAEAMRSMLQAVGIPHEKSSAAPVVTVSIGVATALSGTPIDVETLIACADSALYQCKAKGRNCSVASIVDPQMLESLPLSTT
ncbi:GGDEF domain-containing protein [Halomonas sp. McH1-25]|uniref:GGDEF domain-containing protein n=1 Tax=unclassified Halomonas TaxID=2609666 RepID=UPI001EF4E2FB|nr:MULTISPECIES: GGDEF domain-containing protein [unclassified Halomonas]MCG7598216.1 GGDEF domain-containing protein [Halomonas sp. McH1-25]MCP1341001.1 GGDEF domain-containing protein [Halomonas sp. FL8]MCP1363212.1 GGDEF domain-containing protein [Halomonas sp. BBD45]MCP1365534.1 GGDEF domain-containing protein [Halomonas sp. BBD48]